ncbi:hypothetical protein BGZ98_003323, partial [Dissophora globulifera]
MATSSLPPPPQDCLEFVAAEGRYELLKDIYLDQVLPHAVIPTFVSSVSVKYKDYLNSSSNGTTHAAYTNGLDYHSILPTSHLDRVDEQLRDLKVSDERAADDAHESHAPPSSSASTNNTTTTTGALSGNFHGTLVDIPLDNDEGGHLSPGPPHVVTPGPPPLKDSTSTKRLSDSHPDGQPLPLSSKSL